MADGETLGEASELPWTTEGWRCPKCHGDVRFLTVDAEAVLECRDCSWHELVIRRPPTPSEAKWASFPGSGHLARHAEAPEAPTDDDSSEPMPE